MPFSPLYVIGGIVILFINLLGSDLMAKAAKEKGYDSRAHVFIACFFLGIAGYLYAICLPDKVQRDMVDKIKEQLEEESENRYDTYWAEHEDERNKLKAELNTVNDQISRASNAINAKITSLNEMAKATSDKAEKEKIESQIAYIKTEGQKRLKVLQDRAEEIKNELYRDR